MGCGKTTVAKALAARLQCGMLDLDGIISAQQQLSIPELIKDRGEAGFREAETFALQVVLDRLQPRIIALGGGAWWKFQSTPRVLIDGSTPSANREANDQYNLAFNFLAYQNDVPLV